jgi:serine-type D-Ala-D-Ala carboxypeptidase (penicillin-binding protein 5/6)
MKFRSGCFASCAAAVALAAAASPAAARTRHLAAPAAHGSPVPAPLAPIIGPVDTLAKEAFIIEADTGTVLLDKNGDERIPTASLSKVMTAYVVFRMLKDGRAKLTDQLPVSEAAWRTGGSKMFVPLGARISIDDLLQGVLVDSGNDACVVLAEGLAGSQQAFVDLMNEEAKKLGLVSSHFADVDGLPAPGHYMSEHDLATLALDTIRNFPQYYHYYSQKDFAFGNITQRNRNPLLLRNLGADGLKTGHTEESGYSLLASLHRGKRRVILVLSGLPTARSRAEEGERLADWAFREYNDYKLFGAGQTVDNATVWLGTKATVPLTVARDLVVTLSRKQRKDMKVTVDYDQPVPAPVRRGEKLGAVAVAAPGFKTVSAPLFAAAAVPRIGPFGRMAIIAAQMIWGNRH